MIAANEYDKFRIVKRHTGTAILLFKCDNNLRNSHISCFESKSIIVNKVNFSME